MDYAELFAKTIDELLCGCIDRATATRRIAELVPIDAIAGDHRDLLINCEWALRHANESGFRTTDAEFKYLLSCLNGGGSFDEKARDHAVLLGSVERNLS